MASLAESLGEDRANPWQTFAVGTPAEALCRDRSLALRRTASAMTRPDPAPPSLTRQHRSAISTQAALGRFLADFKREAPEVAARVVTCSPDVASSTNLGGWIDKTGVWSTEDRADWFAGDSERLLNWSEGKTGQHIELGIAEVNLVGLLSELGAPWSRWGERLIPMATHYDPFLARAGTEAPPTARWHLAHLAGCTPL